MTKYKSYRFVDGKARWIIVDEDGNIINKNPSKDELKGIKREIFSRKKLCDNKGYLLRKLIDFYEEKGRIPIAKDFVNNSYYPCFTTYQNHFGSWDKALDAAGLLEKRESRLLYTEKELLDYLLQFVKENRKIPVRTDFIHNERYPGFWVYKDRFGSWSNALKIVGLDDESLVKKGILDTNNQKGRFGEIIIRDHFKNHPIDLAGENHNNPCDGICPNGKTYDVKSTKLRKTYYQFGINNKYREEIEIYYFLAFNEDWTKLDYGWRVPGDIVEDSSFLVGISPRSKFTIDDMEEYDITENLLYILE